MNLVWFRNDLRLHDQPALHAARQQGEAVLALYILSPLQWQQQHRSARQVDLLLRSLVSLQQDLATLNIPLKLLNVPLYADIPAALTDFCQQYQIKQVYCNQEYEWNERLRDRACKLAFDTAGIHMQRLHDQCLLPPKTVLNQSGEFYKGFPPFKKNWLAQLEQAPPQPLPCPKSVQSQPVDSDPIPTTLEGFAPISAEQQSECPATVEEAQRR
ncbi:MAG: deoxyribodipyrimidine photo-lyase, partial [Pseudomonadota bacterium]|nr:deoxyribodipyrimidine photo-lyase [Pseudomonadota bacterium]